MKKIFITMLMAAAATASFAQNEKFDKEVKATKDYNAGLALINSKLSELTDVEKGKAYVELYKLAKPAFDKSAEAAAANNTAAMNNDDICNGIYAAYECQKYDQKNGAKFVEEVKNYRSVLINAANQADDNEMKLKYSNAYISTAADNDPLIGLANFFAGFAYYQKKDYKQAAKFAKGALNDERVKEQAEQVYRVSLEQGMQTTQDSLEYIDALKELNAEKYFVQICNMYTDMGRQDLVNKMVDEAIAANPNNKFAVFMRGSAANEAKKYDEAIKDFEKVIEIDPAFVYGYFNLALCYGNKADEINNTKADKNGRLVGDDLKNCSAAYEGAIANLEKVRELDPNREAISNWPMLLRMYYNRMGKTDKAKEISQMLGDE